MKNDEFIVLGLAGVAVYLILKSQGAFTNGERNLATAMESMTKRYGLSEKKLQSEFEKDGGVEYFGFYGY